MKEINLVPDVKIKMLKAIKMRNLIWFISIIVIASSIGLVLIVAGIMGGQNLAISGQDKKLDIMSKKITGYEGLGEFLTIQDQLGKIQQTNEKKKVLSRVFNVLGVILAQGKDKVTLSELNVDLDNSILTFDAQADAGEEPYIDYRVLESFKKKVGLMKYDYGRYVDASGKEIPTRCIEEYGADGKLLSRDGAVYAIWKRSEKGCNDLGSENTEKTEIEGEVKDKPKNDSEQKIADEEIWRTPKLKQWHDDQKMNLNGEISGIPHFESKCLKYTGTEVEGKVKWTAANNCVLAEEGAKIKDSSNGRNSSGSLVLRFGATIKVDPEVFAFKNKHVMAILPTEQNVTDSYIQIESMFEKKATDCLVGDTGCSANTKNKTGQE